MFGQLPTLDILGNALDYAAKRRDVLADNLANADTPNFKRSDVAFPTLLAAAMNDSPRLAMKTTEPRHIPSHTDREATSVRAHVWNETDTTSRIDGNNVNPEVEMVNLAQNTLYYQTIAQRIRGRYQSLTDVVRRAGQVG